MSTEAQRDIEKDLLAYKQRRREQAGAPLELHPATRKMLQSEAARAAARPLLTSEEAAKNFVRSFVMSHQQPGFFTRHRQRVIWGGAMFACLALVLAVLRNDPQQAARKSAFPDSLPTPPATPEPKPDKPQGGVAATKPPTETERSAHFKQSAPAADGVREQAKFSAAPAGGPAPANPRGFAAPSAPMPTAQREADRRSGGAGAPLPAILTSAGNERGVSAPAGGRAYAKSEGSASLASDKDADRKLAEKPAAGETVKLLRALKDPQTLAVTFEPEVKKSTEEAKLKVSDELKRVPLATAAGAGGALASAAPPVAAPMPATVAASKQQALSFDAGGAGVVPVQQRFQQLDNRAGYRQNFNSPPLPQVMQDFAFERTGDRVRIVDADGSTYSGTVMPAPAEEASRKAVSQLDAAKARKDAAEQLARSVDAPEAYHFIASGVNRKLNQSVEFRGEWLPVAPAQSQPATPALRAASFGIERLESQMADKKEKAAVTNKLSDNAAPTDLYLLQRQQRELPLGRISGRAVVGGKNEFDIKAVSK